MHSPARYDGARRWRHSKTIATSRPDRKPTEVTLVKLVEQLYDDNLYRYDADGVKVVFFGFLEQMNCAESARTREALDVAQDSRDGQVSSCGRHCGHCSRRCAIQFSFGNLFGFRPMTDKNGVGVEKVSPSFIVKWDSGRCILLENMLLQHFCFESVHATNLSGLMNLAR